MRWYIVLEKKKKKQISAKVHTIIEFFLYSVLFINKRTLTNKKSQTPRNAHVAIFLLAKLARTQSPFYYPQIVFVLATALAISQASVVPAPVGFAPAHVAGVAPAPIGFAPAPVLHKLGEYDHHPQYTYA